MIIDCLVGEEFALSDSVKIKVLETRGRQVCLGVTAPRNVSVHREEIYKRIQEDKRK